MSVSSEMYRRSRLAIYTDDDLYKIDVFYTRRSRGY